MLYKSKLCIQFFPGRSIYVLYVFPVNKIAGKLFYFVLIGVQALHLFLKISFA